MHLQYEKINLIAKEASQAINSSHSQFMAPCSLLQQPEAHTHVGTNCDKLVRSVGVPSQLMGGGAGGGGCHESVVIGRPHCQGIIMTIS